MLFFVLLFFFFSLSPIAAQSFNYQLRISDNFINLNFFETVKEVEVTEEGGEFLSFDYQLSSDEDLPPDLPLFLVTLGDRVLFYADQISVDERVQQVVLDTNGELPIFYKNTFIKDFELKLSNFHFVEEMPSKDSLEIKDPLVIREKDQSLTILFSAESASKNNHSFELFCADNNQSANLNKTDDFLWPDFNFQTFLSNHQNEFIFHLESFDCSSSVYLLVDGQNKVSTSIINIEDL